MKRLARFGMGLTVVLALLSAPAANRAQTTDLTGIWKDDTGREYRVRQVGTRLYWSMDKRPEAIRVFQGTVQGGTIKGQWVDLPGGNRQDSGSLTIRVETSDKLVRIEDSGSYGVKNWTRQTSASTPVGINLPSLLQDRWGGTWCLTGGDYTMTLTATLFSTKGIIRNKSTDRQDPMRLFEIKRSGNTMSGQWESDPVFKDATRTGRRYGTFQVSLVQGSSRETDRIEGTAYEDSKSLLGQGTYSWYFVRCEGK